MQVLDQPIDYPTVHEYNAAHPEAPTPRRREDWADLPPQLMFIEEYEEVFRRPTFLPGANGLGNVVVVGAGPDPGVVRLLATDATEEQYRIPVASRPSTEKAVLDLYRAAAQA